MKIAIIGAGAAGLAMAMRLRRAGYDDFTLLERSGAVGGTWHDNRYPGAGCDVPSHLYCFSFAPKPDWNHKFARQPEIERYFQRCVECYNLGPHLQLGTEVHGAQFVDGTWRMRTSRGEHRADVLICGTGQLNRPRIPALPGADTFAGTAFHSARWPATFVCGHAGLADQHTSAQELQPREDRYSTCPAPQGDRTRSWPMPGNLVPLVTEPRSSPPAAGL